MKFIEILEVFNTGITEAQAWAIIYQTSKSLLEERNSSKYFNLPQLNSIDFKENGKLTVCSENGNGDMSETLQVLAESIYYALGYGGKFGLDVTDSLADLLLHMAQLEEDDEGYTADEYEVDCNFEHVIKVCAQRLTNSNNVEDHYAAVTRSFLTEARLLMSFLQNVEENTKFLSLNRSNNNNNDDDLDIPRLGFAEWTKHWVHVVENLRNGVTNLRKVEQPNQNPVAFELTPYEMLMQDIRKQRYTLKKVSLDVLNQKPSNPHDVILDFIKGRPTLNPMENRVLRSPPPRSKSLHERLIEQIKSCDVPLKHVKPPEDSFLRRSRTNSDVTKTSRPNSVILPPTKPNPTHRRRLTAPKFDDFVLYSSSSDEDSENESHFPPSSQSSFEQSQDDEKNCHANLNKTSGVSNIQKDDRIKFASPPRGHSTRTAFRRKKNDKTPVSTNTLVPTTESNILSEKPSFLTRVMGPTGGGVRRAQSMATRSPTNSDQPSLLEKKRAEWRLRRQKVRQATSDDKDTCENKAKELPPPSKQSKKGTLRRSVTMREKVRSPIPSFSQSPCKDACPSFRPAERRENLTVTELIHIREVLARAELEKHFQNGELYSNLKKGKICFTCQIRKFSFFNWASTCQICKQKICSKCARSARAPSDHYLESPISSLSLITSHDSNQTNCQNEDTLASEIQSVLSSKWRKILTCVDCYDLLQNMLSTGPTFLPNKLGQSCNNQTNRVKPSRYRFSTVSQTVVTNDSVCQ